MAEQVSELPPASRAGRPQLYPWTEWLDGRIWKLTQSVEVPGSEDLDEEGKPIPGTRDRTEGDFTVDPEKMRQYARNACRRRKPPLSLNSRVTHEIGERGVKVGVIFIQAVPDIAGEVRPAGGERVTDEKVLQGRKKKAKAAEVAAVPEPPSEAAPAGSVDGVPIVRQGELEQALEEGKPVESVVTVPLAADEMEQVPFPEMAVPEEDEPEVVEGGDPDEWEVISPEEDPDDPYAALSDEELAREIGAQR